VYAIILLIEIVFAFTVTEVASNKIIYTIYISFSFFCEGGMFTIFPALAANIYGA
jgi:hypothetical protein